MFMVVGKFFRNISQKNRKHYFTGLSFNSKKIKKNNIFFAIKGTKINGNKFIKEAVKKGSTTIVSNLDFEGLKNGILYIKSNNSRKLFNAFNTAGGYFQARREEDIKSTHYFCRVNNRRYNFSQNPTYYTGSGELTNPTYVTDPRTYITTVGLYNANSELLAVAKLSKPFLKTPAREAVIKVRLDF